jgi:hypothetical protein
VVVDKPHANLLAARSKKYLPDAQLCIALQVTTRGNGKNHQIA